MTVLGECYALKLQNFSHSTRSLMHYWIDLICSPPWVYTHSHSHRIQSECTWQEIKMPMRSSCRAFHSFWHTLSASTCASKYTNSQKAEKKTRKIFIKTFFRAPLLEVWKLPSFTHHPPASSSIATEALYIHGDICACSLAVCRMCDMNIY